MSLLIFICLLIEKGPFVKGKARLAASGHTQKMADDPADESRVLRLHTQGFLEQGRSLEAEVDEMMQELPGGRDIDLGMELDAPDRPALELKSLDRTARCRGQNPEILIQVDDLVEMA